MNAGEQMHGKEGSEWMCNEILLESKLIIIVIQYNNNNNNNLGKHLLYG